mmetsp:Transcript_40555/g.87030  ORF Transcript_40555/g.87030 Transcript_40555/m.87030 type:complete len:320 (+) Transcript_40555:1046-2005(+)
MPSGWASFMPTSTTTAWRLMSRGSLKSTLPTMLRTFESTSPAASTRRLMWRCDARFPRMSCTNSTSGPLSKMVSNGSSQSTTPMDLRPCGVQGGLLDTVGAATSASRTPVGASTRRSRQRMPSTICRKLTSGVPRAPRSGKSSCRAPLSTTVPTPRSSRSAPSRTTPSPGCMRSIVDTCATRTRKNLLSESCTMAPTTTSWMSCISMACSHLPIPKLPRCALSLVAKGCAQHCATTTASTARRSMTGTSATCSVWASTWPISPRSRIATAPCLSSCVEVADAFEWSSVLSLVARSKLPDISLRRLRCTMWSTCALWERP